EIAGIAQEERDQQEHHADHPVELVRRLVAAAIENVKHVAEDQQHHQVRRDTVHVTQKNAVRDDEAQVFHVPVGVRRGGMVIKHQKDACNHQEQKEEEGERTKIVGRADTKRLFANLDREPVEEEVAKDGHAARAVGNGGATAEDGLPYAGGA